MGAQGNSLPLLQQSTPVNHRHLVTDVAHHRQVVADEYHRETQFPLQTHEQVQDLGLYRDIQRTHHFIANQQRRLHH
jgi:hypothetical protein